ADEQYLLVVANLAADVTPRPVVLTSEAVANAETSHLTWLPPLSVAELTPASQTSPAETATADTRATDASPEAPAAPSSRSFWLKVGRQDSQTPAAWRQIHTQLLAAGRQVAVYADRDDRV